MEYTLAKLHIPKTGNDWYVYFTFRNPDTGVMDLFKQRKGLNRIKGVGHKKQAGTKIASELNQEFKNGWSPFFNPQPEDHRKRNFYHWIDIAIEKSKLENSFYNTQSLITIKNKLKKFKKEIDVKDIHDEFLINLKKFMIKEGNSQNTIADNFTRISIIVKKIVKEGLIPYNKNPFFDYRIQKTKVVRNRIPFHNIQELMNCDLSKRKSHCLARDMYVFSFYFAGIRFGDLIRMENVFITDKLRYTMHKKGNERALPIMPEAMIIIKKYKSKSKYLFPTKFDETSPDQSIKALNFFFNQKLKKVCKELELPDLTYHTARHSFADFAYRKGIDSATMRDLLGHKNIKTTEIYRKSFYEEESSVAMNEIFKK